MECPPYGRTSGPDASARRCTLKSKFFLLTLLLLIPIAARAFIGLIDTGIRLTSVVYDLPWSSWDYEQRVAWVTVDGQLSPGKVNAPCDSSDGHLVRDGAYPASHAKCSGTGTPVGGYCIVYDLEFRAQDDYELTCSVLYDGQQTGRQIILDIAVP